MLGAMAGFLGLWVSWQSLLASRLAKEAARSAADVARLVRSVLDAERAEEALLQIQGRMGDLRSALGTHELGLACYLAREVARCAGGWNAKFQGLGLGKPAASMAVSLVAEADALPPAVWAVAQGQGAPDGVIPMLDRAAGLLERLLAAVGRRKEEIRDHASWSS
jgi:hypothetical protein